MIRYHLLVAFGLIASQTILAQSNGYILLLKGKASVSDQNGKSIVNCRLSVNEPFDKYSTITLQPESRALIFNKNSKMEVGGPAKLKFKGASLLNSLNQSSGMSDNFFSFLQRMYDEMTSHSESEGTAYGGVTRGGDYDCSIASIGDSMTILSDSIRLGLAQSGCELSSPLIVLMADKPDTLYSGYPAGNSITMPCPSPGHYIWKFSTRDEDGLAHHSTMVFFVPDSNTKSTLLSGIKSLQSESSNLSVDTRKMLMEDYLFNNRLQY